MGSTSCSYLPGCLRRRWMLMLRLAHRGSAEQRPGIGDRTATAIRVPRLGFGLQGSGYKVRVRVALTCRADVSSQNMVSDVDLDFVDFVVSVRSCLPTPPKAVSSNLSSSRHAVSHARRAEMLASTVGQPDASWVGVRVRVDRGEGDRD